jgi:hypothetical protein
VSDLKELRNTLTKRLEPLWARVEAAKEELQAAQQAADAAQKVVERQLEAIDTVEKLLGGIQPNPNVYPLPGPNPRTGDAGSAPESMEPS